MSAKDKWQSELRDDLTLGFAGRLARVFLRRAGAAGIELASLIANHDWAAILVYKAPFSLTADEFYNVTQAQAFFTKLVCLPNGVNRRDVALRKFLSGEYRCGVFNRIFEARHRGEYNFSPRVERILHRSACKIDEILGAPPELREVPLRFSPGGATTTIKKKDSDLRNLIEGCVNASEDLLADLPRLAELLKEIPHIADLIRDGGALGDFFQCSTGVLNFVEKNAGTDRAVTNEPDLTKIVQNGYGDTMRVRLKRGGIDLSDSERQCELARIGSIDGKIATIDLSNASGLICQGLVLDQFSPAWSDIFFWARTSEIQISEIGRSRYLEAYAGMGNGLTFPIESVLFHALTWACCEEAGIRFPVCSVYGDDIICSVEAVPFLYEVFAAVGLQVNEDKSFIDGPFRESCGSDWFLGIDVRPVFLRHNISLELLYSLHNQFYDRDDHELCEIIAGVIPEDCRLYGPPQKGDGHLWADNWRENAPYVNQRGFSHYSYQSISMEPLNNFTVTPWDTVVVLSSIDGSYRSRLSNDDQSLEYYLGQTENIEFPFGRWPILSSAVKRYEDNTALPYVNKKLVSRRLQNYAVSFVEPLPISKQQTEKMRDRRGWKTREKCCTGTDPSLAVFGTPLPGSCKARVVTSYVFG